MYQQQKQIQQPENSGDGQKGPQFPYRACTSSDVDRLRSVVNGLILGVDNMIIKIVHCLCAESFEGEMPDICNKVREHLWQEAIPKFDAWQGNKLSTYLHSCIRNCVISHARTLHRRQSSKRRVEYVSEMFLRSRAGGDTSADERIEVLAEAIIENPEKYLSGKRAKILRLIVDNPGMKVQDMAAMLGYRHPRSLSMLISRIRREICVIYQESDETDRDV